MSDTAIAERMASLEAGFEAFHNEVLKDNAYIKQKVDKILEELPKKVDRPYCLKRHEALRTKIDGSGEERQQGSLVEESQRLRTKNPCPSTAGHGGSNDCCSNGGGG